MAGEDTELCGFVDAKLPGNRGMSQKVKKRSLASLKSWKRHWCAVRKMGTGQGIEILLDCSISSGKCDTLNEKENRIKILPSAMICRTESKSKQFSFGIFSAKDKKPLLYLSGASETDTQRWIASLRQLLRPRKHRFMEGSLGISIVDNPHSRASGLTGLHGDLVASSLGVFIKDAHSGEIVQNFEWKEFSQFHLSTVGRLEDVKRICVIHTTKEFRGGVGELYFFCLDAQRLLQDFVTQGRGPKHKIFAQRPLSRSEGDLRLSLYNEEENHSFPNSKSKMTSNLINAGLGLILSSKASKDIQKSRSKAHPRAVDNVYEAEPASNPNFVASFDQLEGPCPRRVSNISIASGIYEEILDDGKPARSVTIPSHLYEDPEDLILNSNGLQFQPPPLPPRHRCGSNPTKNGSLSDDGLDSEGGTRSATPNTQYDTTPTPEERVINRNLIDTSDYVPMSPRLKDMTSHKSEEANTSQEGLYMLSEEVQEARNENTRKFREMFTRKNSRLNTNTDILKRLLVSSDNASLRHVPKRIRGGTILQPVSAELNDFRNKASSKMITDKVLTENNVYTNFKLMDYPGFKSPILIRAFEIVKELEKGVEKPFQEVIRGNIGDAQGMGQKPITFLRQVLTLTILPELLNDPKYPEDAKERARTILESCNGTSIGAYCESSGIEIIRKHVAQYIQDRDGFPSDYNNIILSNGTSDGIKSFLKLFHEEINGKPSGVMIPIPQYPLYAAVLAEFGLSQIGYYLNEENKWSLDISELERSYQDAENSCNPRVLVVINPGNPTGQVLTRENIVDIIKFAHKHRLILLADEVYQTNVYDKNFPFFSVKKVMNEMGQPFSETELASFMSISKGYTGECGLRGGYAEIVNMDPDVMSILLKTISVALCPNILGQVAMDVVVNPPKAHEPSYPTFIKEKTETLESLAKRSHLMTKSLNSIPGYTVNPAMGAIFVFPKIDLPEKAIRAAKTAGQAPDFFYSFKLLEATGICVLSGSFFGQKPGTYHFRTTILPQIETITKLLSTLRDFHLKFLDEYS